MNKVLIVEDDTAIAESLRLNLAALSCDVTVEMDGSRGLQRASTDRFDLIILDVNLPGMNGLDICRSIRTSDTLVPILMLTSRGSEVDIVFGLEQGADDYIVKPFQVGELTARIRALLRRGAQRHVPPVNQPLLSFGPLEVDAGARKIRVSGAPIELTALEFDLLLFLIERQGIAVMYDEIAEIIWDDVRTDRSNAIKTAFARLRKKLHPVGDTFIQTVRGVGYRFEGPSET